MPNYATYSSTVQRYPLLSTVPTSSTFVNSDLLYYSCIELDGLLGKNFDVPFSELPNTPPTITDVTIDLAYWRSIRYTEPKKAAEFKSALMGRIDKINSGDELIVTNSGTQIIPSGLGDGVWSTNEDYHPTESMLDEESGYSYVDSGRIQDLEDERR